MTTDRIQRPLRLVPASDRAQAAAYIAELTSNLSVIARKQGFDTLSYLLDMAQMEAETLNQQDEDIGSR